MTHHETTPPTEQADADVCPHCGSVLDLARAVRDGHNIGHAPTRRRAPTPTAEGPDVA